MPRPTAVCAYAVLATRMAFAVPAETPCDYAAGCRAGHIVRALDPTARVPGEVQIAYERYVPAGSGPDTPTILAIEGGPGGATTGSRDYYLEAFRPLLGDHQLLLVDLRGTGASDAINCPLLQRAATTTPTLVGGCGERLGASADRWSTALAGDDVAAVLDALDIDRVHIYGDSYGTFFVQSFVLRHPERIRSVVLDGTYGVEGLDPWYPEISAAIRRVLADVCGRDPGCAAVGGDPVSRVADLARQLEQVPLTGAATDSFGRRRRVHLDAPGLAVLISNATYEWQSYREIDPAVRAALAGDATPLLRLAGETRALASRPADYSNGLWVAVSCLDYPYAYDLRDPVATRRAAFDAAVAALRRDRPDVFAPFDVDTWIASPFSEYDLCLDWPIPVDVAPPAPTPAIYSDVPVLVLNGELDTITPTAGARVAAARFPHAQLIEIANAVHVTALGDYRDCAPQLLVEFLRTGTVADPGCAALAPPVRVLDAFWPTLAEVPPAMVPALSPADRQVLNVMLATVADVLNRRPVLYTSRGHGLRGGRFRFVEGDVVGVRLRGVELVRGVPVDGALTWHEIPGDVHGTLRSQGLEVKIAWNPVIDAPCALVSGTGWQACVPVP